MRCLAAVLIATCVLLAGCSSTRLAYDHLDWIASWELSDFVHLQGPQRRDYEQAFDALWHWHRSTQLPEYAGLLRHIEQQGDAPPTAEQVLGYSDQVQQLVDVSLRRAVRSFTPVLASLDDAQADSIVAEIDRRAARFDRKRQHTSDAQWYRQRGDELQDRLEDWVGSLTAAQRTQVTTWIGQQARRPDDRDRALARQWRDAFAALLAQRRSPDFGTRLERLFLDPDLPGVAAVQAADAADQARSAQFLAQFSRSLDPAQRHHLQKHLESLARDLDALAAESRS